MSPNVFTIAGAGPAGGALAAGLHRAGVAPEAIVVHDAAPTPGAPAGAFLALSPAALAELTADPAFAALDRLLTSAPPITALRAVGDGGDRVLPMNPPMRMLSRGDLAAAIVEGVRALGIRVHFDSPIDPGPAAGRAATDPTVWLIGADGARSTVRAGAGFGDLPAPTPTSAIARFACDHEGSTPGLDAGVLTFFQGAHDASAGFLRHADGVMSFLRGPRRDVSTLRLPLDDDIVAALDATLGPDVRIWETPLPAQRSDGTSPWRRDRTVLIGDAAHAKSPASGRGATDALLDAVVLAPALADGGVEGVDAALEIILARETAARRGERDRRSGPAR